MDETLLHLSLVRILDKAMLNLAQDHDLNSFFSCSKGGVDRQTGEEIWIPNPSEYKDANEYTQKVDNLFIRNSVIMDFGRCDYLDDFSDGEYNATNLYTFFLAHYKEYNWNPLNKDDKSGLFESEKTTDFYQAHPLSNLSDKTLHRLINELKNDFKMDIDEYYTYVLSNRKQYLTNNIVFCAKNAAPYVDQIILNPNMIKYTYDITTDQYSNFYIYDQDVPETGLGIKELINWAHSKKKVSEDDLKNKFIQECSPGEKPIMDTFIKNFWKYNVPALLPQYYCRRSIASAKTREKLNLEAIHQRADFVMFFPLGKKIIIELDDYNHYIELNSNGEKVKYFQGTKKLSGNPIPLMVQEEQAHLLENVTDGPKYIASAKQYAANMASDRELKLNGYEVYRFGGYETIIDNREEIILDFFNNLFKVHGIRLMNR